MSSGAPNLACEVSLSPIACPRNPGMPEGSLRLVKRRADLAARDPNAGFASAMSELEECASWEERDDAVVDATPSSGVAGGADVASPATASPASPASAARAEAPPVALGARPSQTDPEAARFVAAVMAYAAVTAEETSGSRVGERGAGDVFREMRAGVEEHIMSVVGSQKRTSADAATSATPLEKPEPVESVESVASVESKVDAGLFADSAANGVESGVEPARDPTQDSQENAPAPLAAEPEASAPEARFANRAPPRRRRGASGATAAAALIAAVAVAAAAAFARRLRRAKLPGAPEASDEAKATTNASSEGTERVNRFAEALRAKSRVALRVGAGLAVARDAAARRAAAITGRVAVAARRATAATAARLPFRAAAAAESSSSAAVGDAEGVSEARAEEPVEEAVSTYSDPTSFPASPVPDPLIAVAQTSAISSAISPDPGSDSDPDEAIFEEASKIGRDLIRGLLPTPLMLHGKTKPRWAEGDMSPAMAPAPETATSAVTESAHSPGTPPSELERLDSRDAPVSKYAAEIRGDDVASPNDSSDELSSANDASDSDSDSQYSDSQYSESDSEYDSENSESHVSGIGPGTRAAAPARAAPAFFPPQTLNFAANGFGPFPPGVAAAGGQRGGSPGFANSPGGSPEAAAAAQYQQYQQFVQYQQFMQFQQMQQMQQMQITSAYATPGANADFAPGSTRGAFFGNTFGAASPASPSSREMSKMAVAHRRRALARMAFARLRLQARAARRARSAERRERRRSAGRRQSFGTLESSSPGSRTKKPFVRTQVFEIEQRAAAAALERERETATAMPAMSTPSVGIAA